MSEEYITIKSTDNPDDNVSVEMNISKDSFNGLIYFLGQMVEVYGDEIINHQEVDVKLKFIKNEDKVNVKFEPELNKDEMQFVVGALLEAINNVINKNEQDNQKSSEE